MLNIFTYFSSLTPTYAIYSHFNSGSKKVYRTLKVTQLQRGIYLHSGHLISSVRSMTRFRTMQPHRMLVALSLEWGCLILSVTVGMPCEQSTFLLIFKEFTCEWLLGGLDVFWQDWSQTYLYKAVSSTFCKEQAPLCVQRGHCAPKRSMLISSLLEWGNNTHGCLYFSRKGVGHSKVR